MFIYVAVETFIILLQLKYSRCNVFAFNKQYNVGRQYVVFITGVFQVLINYIFKKKKCKSVQYV